MHFRLILLKPYTQQMYKWTNNPTTAGNVISSFLQNCKQHMHKALSATILSGNAIRKTAFLAEKAAIFFDYLHTFVAKAYEPSQTTEHATD
jgi:citrate lyase synthetase